LIAAVGLTLAASACAGDDAPRETTTPTISTALRSTSFVRVVFNDEGIVVEPPPDGAEPQWTREQALAVIRAHAFFDEGSVRAWFGSYQGQLGWLAIARGLTVAPSRGPAGPGYHVAVFADGESPARALSGVAETGGDPPRVNVGPPRHKYNGRLHVTFVTPTGGPIGGSVAKWMMEPAPWATPWLSLEDAARQARALPIGRMQDGDHLYFGLFTGLDNTGILRERHLGWMIFGTGYATEMPGGPCCDHTIHTYAEPQPMFGARVMSDDHGRGPWFSGVVTAGGHPLVY
jgi:hypothetical protein